MKDKHCTICAHPNCSTIEQRLAAKQPLRQLEREFDVGRMALSRHKQHAPNLIAAKSKLKGVKLTPRQARLVGELAKSPHTLQDAMLRAGYSESTAKTGMQGAASSLQVQELLRTAITDAIPISKLVERISEGLDAKEFRFFASEGRVVEAKALPDYKERRAYVELAAKFGRYFEDKPAASTVELDLKPIEELIRESRLLSDQLERLERTGSSNQTIDIEPAD